MTSEDNKEAAAPLRPGRVGTGPRFLLDVEEIHANPDVADLLNRYRKEQAELTVYKHRPRDSRLLAEIEKLVTYDSTVHPPIRDQILSQLAQLKEQMHLPVRYRFCPRDRVTAGWRPYQEETVRVENFSAINTGSGPATFASGFATFNSNSGVFSIAGYSMGTVADVRAGAIISLETSQAPADIMLTANFVIDYQYQLSTGLNPAYQPSSNAMQVIKIDFDLLLNTQIRDSSGQLVFSSGALKPLKHVELRPDSNLPPFVSGYQEVVSGRSLQGGVLAQPITWEHTVAVPANSRVEIAVVIAPFVSASGHRGNKDYKYLGVADGRASGQITSVEAIVFT